MIAPWILRRRMMMSAPAGVDVANLLIQGSCTFTDYGIVTMGDGNDYRLLAITQSGNLVIFESDGATTCPVNCEVCVVGGGANGNQTFTVGKGDTSFAGAGAYMVNQVIEAFAGGMVIVGAAQGVSSVGGVSVTAVSGINGGTGAGIKTYATGSVGQGDGLSKYPFGDDSYELWLDKPHCAGGAAGGYAERTVDRNGNDKYYCRKGGSGGTNGGNGQVATDLGQSSSTDTSSGEGGIFGGGRGGYYSNHIGVAASNATYYGSGAGGGAYYQYYYENASPTDGGVGYQGIVYVRIPVNQSLLAA